MQVTVNNNQSYWDISLTHTGTAENTWAIAVANNGSITDSPEGNVIVPECTGEPKTVNYLSVRGADPATDFQHTNTFDSSFDNTFTW